MITKIVKVDKEHPDEAAIKEAGEILKNGGLVAFPTETVYGLGGDGLNARSSEKIYQAKGRPSDNPLIIHIANWKIWIRLQRMFRTAQKNWQKNIGPDLLR